MGDVNTQKPGIFDLKVLCIGSSTDARGGTSGINGRSKRERAKKPQRKSTSKYLL